MAETGGHDDAIRRFSVVATVALGVSIVGISYAGVRFDRRWSKVVDLLAGPRASAASLGTSYRARREDVSDVGELVNIVLDEVAQARAKAAR